MTTLDARPFRTALGSFATGVTVITTRGTAGGHIAATNPGLPDLWHETAAP